MLVLELFEKRIAQYQRFKNLLLDQQKALIQGSAQLLNRISQQQLHCLEEIQNLEVQWQKWIENQDISVSEESGILSEWIQLHADKHTAQKLMDYQERLNGLWDDIRQLRDRNQLLIENSLDFVNAMLNQVKMGMGQQVGYHPLNRPKVTNLIVNKKL